MEIVFGTWHWAVSGFLIGMVMLLLIYFGKSFGMSSNLRTMCTMAGAGKFSDFFKFDWREQKWSLAVVLPFTFYRMEQVSISIPIQFHNYKL